MLKANDLVSKAYLFVHGDNQLKTTVNQLITPYEEHLKDILSNKDLKKPNFLDVSDKEWKNLSADDRHNLLFNYVNNNKPPKYTTVFPYFIDEEEWKNATEHERFKMLFKK